MDGEKLCPLVRRPCDSDCAWFFGECDECAILAIACELTKFRIAFNQINKEEIY